MVYTWELSAGEQLGGGTAARALIEEAFNTSARFNNWLLPDTFTGYCLIHSQVIA